MAMSFFSFQSITVWKIKMLTKNLNGSAKDSEYLRVQRLKCKEPGWERQDWYKEDCRAVAQKTQWTHFYFWPNNCWRTLFNYWMKHKPDFKKTENPPCPNSLYLLCVPFVSLWHSRHLWGQNRASFKSLCLFLIYSASNNNNKKISMDA